jgi:D-glycero-D-manno-heptose 1,7-bisphosphate phosphatase
MQLYLARAMEVINKEKAFFLDRDGVINVDHGYVGTPDQFTFIPGVFDACRTIVDHGYHIVIVTNQAGIGRGYYTEKEFQKLSTWMKAQFAEQGIVITDVRFCPHHAEQGLGKYKKECYFRKPNPGMILSAADKHKIDLPSSVLVGDKLSDIEAGRNAGIEHLYFVADDIKTVSPAAAFIGCHDLSQAVEHFFSAASPSLTSP